MKFAPKTLTPARRAEIGEAVDSLDKAIKRANRNGAETLRLQRQMDALEEEHAALSSQRTLSRDAATIQTAIVAQKARLATAIQEEEAGAAQHLQALNHVINAVQPLTGGLAALAVDQVRAEMRSALAPFFAVAGQLAQVATQSELEGAMVAQFRRGFSPTWTLAHAVANAETIKTILSDIAADRDFFSLPQAALAA